MKRSFGCHFPFASQCLEEGITEESCRACQGDLRWELDLEESQVRVSTAISAASPLSHEPPRKACAFFATVTATLFFESKGKNRMSNYNNLLIITIFCIHFLLKIYLSNY